MATITVLGAGMMGSALCVPLCDRGHDVRLVGTHLDEPIIASLRETGRHPRLEVELPAALKPFDAAELPRALARADLVALGVSSAGIEWAAAQLAPLLRAGQPLFMITKGLAWDGARLRAFPDMVRERLAPGGRADLWPAAIAGPCIAGELARRVPTCVVLAGRNDQTLAAIAAELRTDYYHLWTSTDVVGVEICAALKNAYAMGVAFGLGMHRRAGGAPGSVAMHNVEAAVFAQAIVELRRLVVLLGGNEQSVGGLPGVGDLDVTTNGGRTGRFGALLGEGLDLDEAVERMSGATLECLEIIAVVRPAVRSLRAEGRLGSDELPLFDHLAEVVLERAPVALPLERFFGGQT